MKKLLLVFLLCILWFFGLAQPLVKITGTIRDTSNVALAKVTIAVLDQKQSTLSSEQGNYTIYANTTSFRLKFSLLGYKSVVKFVRAKKGEHTVVDVVLNTNVAEMEQVNIISKQNQLSNSIAVNTADLLSMPTVSGNFEAVLKTLPGVSTNNELSSQYSVRGGNFDENLVYLNDVEITRPMLVRNGQQEGLSFINPDLASRVRFSAGGFGARYGDKLSSVLDVRYDKPDSNQYTVSGGLLGASVTARTVKNNNFFLLGLRYKNNSSILGKQDVSGSYNPNFLDGQLLYHHSFSSKFAVSTIANFNKGTFKLIPEDRQTQFGTMANQLSLKIDYEGREVDTYQTYGGAITGLFTPNANWVVKWINSYFTTQEQERFDIEGSYIFDALNQDAADNFGMVRTNRGIGTYYNYGRNSLTSRLLTSEVKVENNQGNHAFSAGIKLEYANYIDSFNEYNYVDSAGYILPNTTNGFAFAALNSNNNLTINTFSGFLQDSYTLNANTDLQLGARINYNNLSKQILVSPRLLLAYRPQSNNKIVRLTAGIYQQAPSFRSIRNFDGQLFKHQLAQRSYNVSFGYDYAFDGLGTRLKFTSEAYFKYADRMVPYIVDNVRIRYLADQQAKARTYGADFSIGGEFVKDLVSYFRVSLMRAEQDIIGDSYQVSDANGNKQIITPGYLKRPTDQRVNFSMFFQDRLLNSPTYKVHVNLLYGSKLPVGSPMAKRYTDDFKIPAYRRLDIGFSKDFLDESANHKPSFLKRYFSAVIVYAEVFNLLNIDNTVSYLWIKDVDNISYAVPNFLTGRQLNLKMVVKF